MAKKLIMHWPLLIALVLIFFVAGIVFNLSRASAQLPAGGCIRYRLEGCLADSDHSPADPCVCPSGWNMAQGATQSGPCEATYCADTRYLSLCYQVSY